jgi:7-cyano-7-deazaguanine synthase
MVLLALAAAYAEAKGVQDVFYGAQRQDEYGYWDCSGKFVERLNDVLSLNRGKPVRVHAPFARMRKAEVLRLGLELGVDYEHTWTCYRGGAKPCGTCPSCVERDAAFREVSRAKRSG